MLALKGEWEARGKTMNYRLAGWQGGGDRGGLYQCQSDINVATGCVGVRANDMRFIH